MSREIVISCSKKQKSIKTLKKNKRQAKIRAIHKNSHCNYGTKSLSTKQIINVMNTLIGVGISICVYLFEIFMGTIGYGPVQLKGNTCEEK